MTEWWLRKAVICHLSPIFCNYYFVYEGTPDVPTYTLRGERDLSNNSLLSVFPISTHTLRGERDISATKVAPSKTHFNSHAPWGA